MTFGSDTAAYFRREILGPFLAQYLKEGAPKANVPPVLAFETGSNTWRRLPAWPAGSAEGSVLRPTPLYLAAGLKLSFKAPQPGEAEFAEYVSDPAKPVPFRARPIQPIGYFERGLTWPQWLVDDQREASGRRTLPSSFPNPWPRPGRSAGNPSPTWLPPLAARTPTGSSSLLTFIRTRFRPSRPWEAISS